VACEALGVEDEEVLEVVAEHLAHAVHLKRKRRRRRRMRKRKRGVREG